MSGEDPGACGSYFLCGKCEVKGNYSVGLRIYCADRTISLAGKPKSHRRRRFRMDLCNVFRGSVVSDWDLRPLEIGSSRSLEGKANERPP